MNPKLKHFLMHDYRSYNAVQILSVLLALVVIHTSPEFDSSVFVTAGTSLLAGNPIPLWNALISQFTTLAEALNTSVFWGTLAAYLVAVVVSVLIYARHATSDTPVRASFMLIAIPVLLIIASATSANLWTAFSIFGPVAAIILTSGFLYNEILAFVRTHIVRIDTRN
jgi:hypothetical protein